MDIHIRWSVAVVVVAMATPQTHNHLRDRVASLDDTVVEVFEKTVAMEASQLGRME